MDTVTLSKADLEALVQKLVDQRVNERLNDMQSSLEHLKGQVTHGGGNVPEDRATLVGQPRWGWKSRCSSRSGA